MNLSRFALTALATTLTSASAFTPAASSRAFIRSPAVVSSFSKFSSTTTTSLKANVLKLTEPEKDILDGVDVFIFDCDGVIWRGDSVIPGIPSVLDKLRALGKKMFFVTNNSTKSRAGYKKKFDSLGLNVPAEEIFSSSFAAAAYLEQTKFKDTGKKAYVIGEIGILEELDLIGVPYLGGPEDAGKVPPMGPGDKLDYDKDVGAVIVGFDRNINYHKIQYAQLCINENEGCEFIATNTDAVTHLTDAQEWAGNGSMVGAIKGCTGQEPTVVGKPSPLMIDYLCDKLGLERGRICMVGDRLDTDILFGTDNGLKTLLVLSGVTTEEKLLSQENVITPDFYADSINAFFEEGAAAEVAEEAEEVTAEVEEAKESVAEVKKENAFEQL
uniref:Phosphoglycolate phosphatase n=1 Tax=Ditylum brightwellii TaxID=49249 RepID=A0A6V2E814_9STRA|mmetsp:Transcript_54556/g.81253  ORF Transcript_54556/g.81253 Transcript_54556/m.81253 type:complete len:385 (+) Transcript_54556:81-1235(+)